MKDDDRFSRAVIETLAKRAGNTCSNPDCQAPTSGPADAPDRSVNVGEAAHIFGARLRSARYDKAMAPAERSNITNGIWLCCTCHKMVDDDEAHYPAGLLFEWRREHEQATAARIGKTGEAARQRYIQRQLADLGPLSYRAEQIVIEKPDFWEYLLTAELLRSKVVPVLRRWRDLDSHLYARAHPRVSLDDAVEWFQDRVHEALELARPFNGLLNQEFAAASGEPGSVRRKLE